MPDAQNTARPPMRLRRDDRQRLRECVLRDLTEYEDHGGPVYIGAHLDDLLAALARIDELERADGKARR
jgi:hypothetical protein